MSCKKYSQWISLYIDGELDGEDLITFEAHIKSCQSCQEEVQIISTMIKDIQNLAMIDPPEMFHKDVMNKIKEEKRKEKHKKWYDNFKFLSAAAAVFVISVILIGPFSKNAPKEMVEEIGDQAVESRMMKSSEGLSVASSKEASQDQVVNFAADVQESSLFLLEEEGETWEVKTRDYNEDKETITRVAKGLGLQVSVFEEFDPFEEDQAKQTRIEMTVTPDEKAALEAEISAIDKTISMPESKQAESQEQTKLVIMITQITQ